VFRPGGTSGTILADNLFPFPDGYTFYSGGCTGADPDSHVPDYFSTNPGFVNVGAGGNAAVTVREPALNVQVRRGTTLATSTPFTGGYVVIRSETAGCDPTPSPVVINGGLTATATLPAANLHWPFGRYRICVDDRNSGVTSTNRRFVEQTGILLNDPNGLAFNADGTPTLKLFIDSDLSTNRATCSST
jgi:hypothetical protein